MIALFAGIALASILGLATAALAVRMHPHLLDKHRDRGVRRIRIRVHAYQPQHAGLARTNGRHEHTTAPALIGAAA